MNRTAVPARPRLTRLLAVVLLAAISPIVAAKPAAADCTVGVDSRWERAGAAFAINATAIGPTCGSAALLLTIRGTDGTIRHLDAFDTTALFGFEAATDPAGMRTALVDWLSPTRLENRTTGTLAPWPPGAPTPEGEFVFIPDQWVDRGLYEELRAQDLPLLCFVQGFESESCLVLESDGFLTPLGIQIFPG